MVLSPNGDGFSSGVFFEIGFSADFKKIDIESRTNGAEFKTLESAAWNTLAYEIY